MEKSKRQLDDFLRDKLNGLPSAPVPGFEKLEQRLAAKQDRSVFMLFLIPLLASGIFWLSTITEGDLVVQPEMPNAAAQPTTPTQIEAPILIDSAVDEVQQVSAQPRIESQERTKPVISSTPSIAVASNSRVAQNFSNANAEDIGPAEIATAEQLLAPEIEQIAEAQPLVFDGLEAEPEILEAEPTYVYEAENKAQEVVAVSVPAAPATALPAASASTPPPAVSPISANTSRWSVHANFYPNYTFRELSIKPEFKNVVDSRFATIVSESERGGFAFNAGIAVRYNLGNDVFISSGLGYIEMKVTGNYDYINYENIELAKADDKTQRLLVGKTENHFYQQATVVNQGIIQAYRYLQVPLHLSYQPWATNKLRLLIESGFSYVRFISADGMALDPITMVPRELSDVAFTQNLGSFDFKIGFAYFVNQQVSVGLEPSLMYFSNSIFPDDNPLYVVPWSVGVNFNVALRLY
jgi:hypothetical protein